MADPGRDADARATERRTTRRQLLLSVVRGGVMTGLLTGVYVLAPLNRKPDGVVIPELLLALLVFTAVVGWQVIAVARSSYPGLRAVEIVAVSVPVLILLFSSAYVVTAAADPDSFSEHLTRMDAVYFTVTVLSTVGFGDIAPHTETARSLVTIQMLVDLALIGVIAKVLFGVVERRRQALDTDRAHAAGGSR